MNCIFTFELIRAILKVMNEAFLQELGLTKAQAVAYIMLVKNNPSTPPALASLIGESRTNIYKILESLDDIGLVRKDDTQKKRRYWANNPSVLTEVTKKKLLEAESNAKLLDASLPTMLSEFLEYSEQPSVRYYQGGDGLKQIYLDQIAEKQEIYIIRPHYNLDAFDFDYMTDIRRMARDAGIKRYAITPDRPLAPKNFLESDPYMLLERTWMQSDDYTAPVEWNAYGDKVAIMSFGSEAIGLIIESPQIATSLRQLFKLLSEGLKRRPNYESLPLQATYIGDSPTTQANKLTPSQKQKLSSNEL